MKTLSAFLSVLGVLWLLGIGCKKPVEPVIPPVVTQPPSTSTTPPSSTTTTPPSSTTTAPPSSTSSVAIPTFLPVPADNRILKITYKAARVVAPFIGQEQVTVDGRLVKVWTEGVTVYHYDKQGRVFYEALYRVDRGPDSSYTYYTYQPNQVLILVKNKTDEDYRDTIRLDSRGLATTRERRTRAEYDPDGYAIRLVNTIATEVRTITNGNMTSSNQNFGSPTGRIIIRLTYDPQYEDRQPQLKPYYGRRNKNLPSKFIEVGQESSYGYNGDLFQMDYFYTYDLYGRITKQIRQGRSLNPQWAQGYDSGNIGVHYYEYTQ